MPPGESHLLRSQVAAYKKQIPLMYLIVDANVLALSFTHFLTAPYWLTLLIPAFLVIASLFRMIGWWRMRNDQITNAYAARVLRSTNIFAVILGCSFVSWALALYPYGDIFAQMHVVFFIGITFVACAFCLMHVRTAAYLLMLVVLLPFTAFFGSSGNSVLIAITLNLIAVSLAISVILQSYYRDFIALNKSRSELQRLHDEVVHLADSDSLTQLANRRRFFSELNRRLTQAVPIRQRVTIGVLDLDGFKGVNDAYGHRAGDQVLIEVGRRLRALAKDFACIARLGGDEFAVVVKDANDPQRMARLAQSIIDTLSQPYEVDQYTIYIGASVGTAIGPRDGRSVEMLIRSADLALYKSKDQGGGAFNAYEPQFHAHAEERRVIEIALRKALERNEFEVHYQPVVNAQSGTIESFEALLRWNNPDLGSVSPFKFIPIAEEARLIGPIGEWVLRTACKEAARWPSTIRVAVNVSAEQLHDAQFATTVVSALSHAGLPPHRLELEVTESVFMREGTKAIAVLEQILALGVRLALDDFGTGYSSLGYLSKTKFSTIKVDRSFVQGAAKNLPESLAIIRAVVALADSLGMSTTAEGVETDVECEMIKGLGCRKIQGYLFGRPMPAAEARRVISTDAQLRTAA